MEALEPFFGIHPTVLQQRIDWIKHSPKVAGRVEFLNITKRSATITGQGDAYLKALTYTTIFKEIPYNLTLIVNTWDEPMVSASWETFDKALDDSRKDVPQAALANLDSSSLNSFLDAGSQYGWRATSHACSFNSPFRQLECQDSDLKDPLSFVQNVTAAAGI